MLNGVYHYGASDGKTEGPMLNPMMASASNPYGAIPETSVGYEMTTSMIMFGVSYNFNKQNINLQSKINKKVALI